MTYLLAYIGAVVVLTATAFVAGAAFGAGRIWYQRRGTRKAVRAIKVMSRNHR